MESLLDKPSGILLEIEGGWLEETCSAEVSELIGIYMLINLVDKFNKSMFGLYSTGMMGSW